jgi:5,5'-dehydrodivanillate O-demethylase
MNLKNYWTLALTGIEPTIPAPKGNGASDALPPGQIDFVHTGPGTLAGRYLRQFWQPVYVGALLEPGDAKPIRIMGEDLTIYRGEGGAPHLVGHRCAHRRTQLAAGSVEGDDIRCLYHGWKYAPTGQCIEQPAEHQNSFADKIRIPAYPVKEYLGLIFAYFGEGAPPEFPRFPDFEDPSVLVHVAEQTYLRRANYFQAIENVADAAHVGIAHRTFPGAYNGLLDSPVPYAEETSWGMKLGARRPSGKERWHQFGMPNVNHQYAFSVHAGRIEILVWFVPVDDEQHINFGVSRVPLQGEARDRYLAKMDETFSKMDIPPTPLAEEILAGRQRLKDIDRARVHTITLEDHIAMAGQGRITDRSEEHLGKSDAAIIVLRRLWQRELRAFAEGRPPKRWVRTAELKPSEWREVTKPG